MARTRTGVLVSGVVLGLVVLAGCETSDRGRDRDGGRYDDRSGGGGGSSGGILGRRVDYRCDDDRRFTAGFQPLGGGVSVDAGGRTYRLQPRDGGGDRYRREYRSEDGDVRLETDGDRAELRIEGEDDYRDCEAR